MNEPPSETQETAVEELFSACAASHLMSCLPSPSIVPAGQEHACVIASSHPSARASFAAVAHRLPSAHVSLAPCEAFAD